MWKIKNSFIFNTILLGSSETGYLNSIEFGFQFNTFIERVYIITRVKKNATRGNHAHISLNQYLTCPIGKISIFLDDGKYSETIILDSQNKVLHVGSMVWHSMTWLENNSILVVAADKPYKESDYIRDYNKFYEMVNNED